jgi:hypothetical protein
MLTATPPCWSLWIDHAHHHRLVELVHVVDAERVRLQPIRDARQRPPSYLEATARLLSPDYEQLTPRP